MPPRDHVHTYTPRGKVDVARAYVDGLERDREELHTLQQQYDHLIWEVIQISTYAKALHTALSQFAKGDLPNWERLYALLDSDRNTYNDAWSCACGHHRWDHDEDGKCSYLTCKRICG